MPGARFAVLLAGFSLGRFREIVAATWSSLSSLEGPAFRTMKGLLLEPGRVARRWIDGKRTVYLHPVKFLFLVSVIIALSYEPLMVWRHSMQVSGSPSALTFAPEMKASTIMKTVRFLRPAPLSYYWCPFVQKTFLKTLRGGKGRKECDVLFLRF